MNQNKKKSRKNSIYLLIVIAVILIYIFRNEVWEHTRLGASVKNLIVNDPVVFRDLGVVSGVKLNRVWFVSERFIGGKRIPAHFIFIMRVSGGKRSGTVQVSKDSNTGNLSVHKVIYKGSSDNELAISD